MKWLCAKIQRQVAADCINLLMSNYTMPSYAAALMREKYGLDMGRTPITRKPKPQYKCIHSRDDYGGYSSFAEDVSNHIADGWELVGGVSVSFDKNNNPQYWQSLVKIPG